MKNFFTSKRIFYIIQNRKEQVIDLSYLVSVRLANGSQEDNERRSQ